MSSLEQQLQSSVSIGGLRQETDLENLTQDDLNEMGPLISPIKAVQHTDREYVNQEYKIGDESQDSSPGKFVIKS